MSSLIFYTSPTAALVATDTLATDGETFSPVRFTTKAHYVPHLRMIIAGTGVGGFADDWFAQINKYMLVKGIDNLDEHTTSQLQELWDTTVVPRLPREGMTTTIYHIGYSESTGEIRVLAYRSVNGFESESLPYEWATKPPCEIPEGDNAFDLIEPIMREQRRAEAEVPPDKRVHIGGEAIVMYLSAEGCGISTPFRFEDYESQSDEAFRIMAIRNNPFGRPD